MKKRVLTIIMTIISAVAMLTIVPDDIKPFDTSVKASAAASDHTADDAIAWVNSKVGWTLDPDGAYGGQCVDLIDAYLEYLGYNWRNYLVSGAKDFAWRSIPAGWGRYQGAQPQKGDILVFTSGQYGHVAIYESDYVTYHQNYAGRQYVQRITNVRYTGSGGYWGVLRPNFRTAPNPNYKSHTVTSSAGVKVRSGAGLGYGQKGGLARGSVVYYDKSANANGYTWYHIASVKTASGSWGSIVGNWIADIGSYNPNPTPAPAPTTKSYTIRSSIGAKVRTGAGLGYGQMGGLGCGTVVNYDKAVNANGYTWYHIVSAKTAYGTWGSYVGYWVANV